MPAFKHKNKHIKQKSIQHRNQQGDNGEQYLYQLLDNGEIEAAYQIVSQNINASQSLDFLDMASEICQMNGDIVNAQRAIQIALQKGTQQQNLSRYMQLFGLNGDPRHLNQVLNYYSKKAPTQQADIERYVFANAYLSQHFIQVQPDEQKMMQYALEASKYNTLVGLIQLSGALLVSQKLQECNEAVNKVLTLMCEQGMLIQKEGDDGNYLEAQPNQFTPESQFLLNFSRVLTGLERLEDAELIGELIRSVAPEDPVVLHELAWIANLQDRYEEATELLLKARHAYLLDGCLETDETIKDIDAKLQALQGNV